MAVVISVAPSLTGQVCTSVNVSYSGSNGSYIGIYRDGVEIDHITSPPASGTWNDASVSVGTTYSYQFWQSSVYSNSESITPKDNTAPTIGTASQSGSTVTAPWTRVGSVPDYWNVYRDVDGGGFSVIATRSAGSSAYDDGSATHGTTVKYKIGSVISGYPEGVSSESNSVVVVSSFTDTITDTVTVSDGQTNTFLPTDTITDTVTAYTDTTDQANYTSTVTDTVTASDSVGSAQTLKTDFTYYIGTEVGAIYEQSLDYQYDDTATSGSTVEGAIVPVWYSKTIDCAENNEENTGKWKTLYRIEYIYRDWGSVPVSIHASNDGGATWTTKTKTIGGSNSGKTEHAHFHFNMTGQFFIFKIEWPSSTADFQFLGMDMIYADAADQWEVADL